MAAPEFDISLNQGAIYQQEFDYYLPDGVTLFPWPVGTLAAMQIRDGHEQLPIYLTLDNGSNGGITLTSPGRLFVTITGVQTQSLEQLSYRYDIKITFADATPGPVRLVQGKVKVSQDITQ